MTGSSPNLTRDAQWPRLAFDEWRETGETLHMWTQVVGKLNVELAPFVNQLWQTALQLTARGLTTGPLPYQGRRLQADFDFVAHALRIVTSDGGDVALPLRPQSVADFYAEVMATLAGLEIDVQINTMPQEIPNPIPFEEDTTHASYDPEMVARWWAIMASSARVAAEHRRWFVGKASPVQFYWGSFDLSVTRYSGRPHPASPGSGYIYRVAESEQNWAAGFWPGSGVVDYPAYYAYAYPQPDGIAEAAVAPEAAFWSGGMREFLLPYEAVRAADDSATALTAFLQSTYAASATFGDWDRARLEIAEIPRPR